MGMQQEANQSELQTSKGYQGRPCLTKQEIAIFVVLQKYQRGLAMF